MKNFSALVLLMLVTVLTFAQNNDQDVVYLKNGGIIRGVITEQGDQSLKIETIGRNVFVYQLNEIEKLSKEPWQDERTGSVNSPDINGPHRIAEVGYQMGVGDYAMDRWKMNFIYGYQFNSTFSIGLGTGLRYYFEEETALIPVFTDIRTTLMDRKVSPYLSLAAGYSFDLTNDPDGAGFLFNPALGVRFMASETVAVHVGLGYEMQKMESYALSFSDLSRVVRNANAITINIGVSF